MINACDFFRVFDRLGMIYALHRKYRNDRVIPGQDVTDQAVVRTDRYKNFELSDCHQLAN
jgi:hypothetical protein